METLMRALILALAPAIALASACAAAPPAAEAPTGSLPPPQAMSDDCAIIAAIAKEHYRFGSDNPPPPLRGAGDEGWTPRCRFESLGFTFAPYSDPLPDSDPRIHMTWVSFHQPVYDSRGALVQTEIVHGPLAGIGYECRVHSGIAGWTVGECKTGWVS